MGRIGKAFETLVAPSVFPLAVGGAVAKKAGDAQNKKQEKQFQQQLQQHARRQEELQKSLKPQQPQGIDNFQKQQPPQK